MKHFTPQKSPSWDRT